MSGELVLVARLDNLGDVLLTGPAVRAVAAGASRVTFLAGPKGAPAARLLPGVDEVVTFDAPWVGDEPARVRAAGVGALVDRLAGLGAKRALIFTSSHQSPLPLALLLRLAGFEWIGAFSHDYPGSLLDVRLRSPGDVHEVERALLLAGAAGYRLPAGDDGALRLRVPIVARRPVPERYVVVHPGASVPARALPFATTRALVARLVDEGWKVVITGSEAERQLAREISSGLARVHVLAGDTDLVRLATVLASAAVAVTGNTGAAHVAAAVATPVVSVFAPVVPAARWRPWRVPHVVLGDQEIACARCRARTCPRPGQPCLAEVTPAAVVDAIGSLTGAIEARAS